MPGKDLAAKLRDFGFSQAKSHMSALDSFEVLQAEGLLEANGIMPTASQGDAEESEALGGLKIKKKTKKKKAQPEELGPETGTDVMPETPPVVDAPETPTPAEVAEAHVDTPAVKAPSVEEQAPTVDASAETVADAPVDGAVEEAPAATDSPAAEVPEPTAEAPEQEAAVAPETVSSEPNGSPQPVLEPEVDTIPEPATAEPVAEAPEAAPVAEATDAGVADTATEPVAEAPAAEAPAPEATPTAEAAAPDAEQEDASKPKPKPKGNVVGFIDPTSFQRAEPKRKAESRRLQSRDDFTPDVRPTFTGGKGGRGGSGPRGNLTAAQLREREQGRFLRRSGRPQQSGGGGGGRRHHSGGSRSREDVTTSPLAGSSVAIEAPVTVGKLAESLKLKSGVILKKALQEQFGMFTVNTLLDDDTVTLLGDAFDVEVEIKQEVSAEQAHLEDLQKKRSEIGEEDLVDRAPTVAFLGHVDHGKTTLIDKIRETKVADHESGGITQHIGAYQVTTNKGHTVTIVDTPGHQAFTAMRARGAKSVDVVVLVVAGDDGVKPSTEEAIAHARAAETPIVVALNKADKPDFNANAAIQQLMGHELIPEQYGGTTAMFETSGMTGQGIDELLEHIFLMGELELGLKAHPTGPASGVVLEAEIQQGRGIVAHLLVQDGTLNRGDIILAGEGYGKVKSIHNDRGQTIQSAGPSTPVEVSGLDALPGVGDPFLVMDALNKAKEIAVERERTNRAVALAGSADPRQKLEAILGTTKKEIKVINLIVRADVQGSAEVIRHEIEKLKHEEVEVKLVHAGVGPITESDVDLAATSDALLVAFHVGVNGKARQEADRHGLDVRRYDVIYELLDDLRNLMEGALSPEFEEEIQGHVEIRRIFKSSKIGLIAGCYVLDGIVKRSSKIRLLRDDVVIHSGEIGSLRREKEDAKEVREGFECGVVLKDFRDIKEGDIIEAYRMKAIKRTLEGGRA